ncbi:hypothetical protein Tco_0577261, partial [Tanacetum coccineum]
STWSPAIEDPILPGHLHESAANPHYQVEDWLSVVQRRSTSLQQHME